MRKALVIKSIITWAFLSGITLLFLGMFVRLMIIEIMSGREDIFYPGILAVVSATLILLIFCIRQAVKNYKRYKSI
jgi:hypothetical protein